MSRCVERGRHKGKKERKEPEEVGEPVRGQETAVFTLSDSGR